MLLKKCLWSPSCGHSLLFTMLKREEKSSYLKMSNLVNLNYVNEREDVLIHVSLLKAVVRT